jgi:serine/threonine protein kinase
MRYLELWHFAVFLDDWKISILVIEHQKVIFNHFEWSTKIGCFTIAPELFDLISKILVKDPNERLTIPQMKDHIWLKGFQYRNDEDDIKYKILRSGMEECKNKFIIQRYRKR